MSKQEFIDFLTQKANERKHQTHWAKIYTNSDDHWELYVPCVDWFADSIDLTVEGFVKVEYDKSMFDNTKIFQTTYEDFMTNYDKTV